MVDDATTIDSVGCVGLVWFTFGKGFEMTREDKRDIRFYRSLGDSLVKCVGRMRNHYARCIANYVVMGYDVPQAWIENYKLYDRAEAWLLSK